MHIDDMIPVPPGISRLAWECCHVLIHDYNDRLSHDQQMTVRRIVALDPEGLPWADVDAAKSVYAAIVERRT